MVPEVEELNEELAEGKTGRVYVRLPMETIREIEQLVSRSGVTKHTFLPMAIVLGCRALDRALNPELALSPALARNMAESMANVMTQPEKMAQLVALIGDQEQEK